VRSFTVYKNRRPMTGRANDNLEGFCSKPQPGGTSALGAEGGWGKPVPRPFK
jgi:hypothetical protein